ncbi:Alpha/Beta hydrolase protein [Aspergillus pseudoustus]|uniref:Alpha/Beta hydrolase protein n=1 Tax=Aspergillus pseudoustus TaxID=1810923 RepID=A0ABR4JYW3_9EURO
MIDFSQYQGPVAEWEEFAASTNFANAATQDLTPLELRMRQNSTRISASRMNLKQKGLLHRISWVDHSITTRDSQVIVARVYRSKGAPLGTILPVYLYYHGGGHLFGSIETEDFACGLIVTNYPPPGIIVVSVNYRHTPEFRWPTQLHDAWDAFEWLSENIEQIGGDQSRVVVGGISAGGGLAAGVVLHQNKLLHEGQPAPPIRFSGQVLCSPWILHPLASPFSNHPLSSFNQNQTAPNLPWSALKLYSSLLGEAAITDSQFNVALSTDDQLQGLPKTGCLVSGQDLLRDEALYFGDRLNKNGTPTKVHVFPGLPHGFRRFTSLWSASRWEELIRECIQWCLSDDTKSSFVVESNLTLEP